jgi:hypothetical protein
LIRRRCFDERRYFYIRKTKGNVLQLAYKLLGTYDNKNIINYIRELVNINNTTENLMRCRLRPRRTARCIQTIAVSWIWKIIWNRNRRPPERRRKKILEQEKMSARLMGTTIDSNLDITIKNKLYDVRTSLYTDYTEYSDDPAKGGFY